MTYLGGFIAGCVLWFFERQHLIRKYEYKLTIYHDVVKVLIDELNNE